MKHFNLLTLLILVLFGLLLWEMVLGNWGTWVLLVTAEAGLIAVRVTQNQESKRLNQ